MGSIGNLVPKEEMERVIKWREEYLRTHPFPSCATCKNQQITVLKYRKYKDVMRIIESTEKCKLNLDFNSGSFRRAVKCIGYEYGDYEYLFKKKIRIRL
jgi:hypothetical protein